MIQQSDIIVKASEFVSDLFKDRLPGHLLYHTYGHTESVAKTAFKIGKEMKLGEEGLEIVTLASWFHDTGYIEKYAGHEESSVRIASEFLEKEYYPKEKIELIIGCIRATKIPQQPKNLLEEVVADADLSGLGKKSFFEKSELLHGEWEIEFRKKYSDIEWTQQNISLLSRHKYFTPIAQESYTKRQNENLLLLQKKLRELTASQDGNTDPIEQEFIGYAPERSALQETGTQMLFKLVSNTLMIENLSADHKSLIITFTGSILIVLCFALLICIRLIGLTDLAIQLPLFLLACISGFAVFNSVLAIRQQHGQRSRNSLFGFFYAMTYDDFDKRMKETGGENDSLPYPALLEEYFELRFIVAKKYQYIHRSYTFFMYGFCLTIVLFITLLSLHL